jgi:hypothetical protein
MIARSDSLRLIGHTMGEEGLKRDEALVLSTVLRHPVRYLWVRA